MGNGIYRLTALLVLFGTAPATDAQELQKIELIIVEETDTVTDTIKPPVKVPSKVQSDMLSRISDLYKTPEASAFREYGRFGTEGSDGSADISIPVYTVKDRDLRIPISLHYGGRGIRVDEEASWVGLGWDLPVGGCINYVAAGQYDFLSRNAQWSDYLKVLDSNPATEFQLRSDLVGYNVREDLVNGLGERDFYSVNILGKSFLFFTNPSDEKPVVIGSDDSDYSVSRSGADGWSIKDCMGNIYEFSALEYTLTGGAGMRKSAWYMSSIETPEGATATFSYEMTNVKGLPKAYQWYDAQRQTGEAYLYTEGVNSPGGTFTYSYPAFGSGASFANTEIRKPWLKSITTNNQKVIFETSGRTDFGGARKLDRIRVTDINGTGVFVYHFNYGTFASSKVGGICPETSRYLESEPRNSERLKLSSFSEMSDDGKDSLTHVFAYHEKYPLPMKTSAAVDFWGYYNGQENNSRNSSVTDSRSLIPSLQDCIIGYTLPYSASPAALAVKGACRFSDSEKIVSGTLSEITYPTGGKSVFTFEPHKFRSSPVYPLRNVGYKDVSASVEDLNYPSTATNPGPVINRQLDIKGMVQGYLTVIFEARSGKKLRDLQQAKASVTVQPMASPVYRRVYVTLDSCRNVDLESTYHKETFPVTLEALSYMFVANLPSQIAYGGGWVKASLEFRELDPALESGGAGLRIAAIDNYDDDGTLTGRREFEYTDEDGSTSGRLLVASRAAECRTKYLEHVVSRNKYGENLKVAIASLNIIKINSSPNGGPAITDVLARGNVGYSRVRERELDANLSLIRETVSEYNVTTSREPVRDLHLFDTFGGGELTRRTVSDASGNTLLTEDYEYTRKSSKTIKCNIHFEDQYLERVDDVWEAVHRYPRYLVSVYPYRSFWRVLSGITAREHTPSGIRESKSTRLYNESNCLLSEESVTEGKRGSRTKYSYTVDYTSYPYTSMASAANYLRGIPVETTFQELRDGVYTESRKEKISYLFRPAKAAMLLASGVEESVNGNPLQTRESLGYSDDGSLVESVHDTAYKNAYIWSYDNTYPVAVIEGATYQEVQSWAGTALISSLSKAKSGIESMLAQLRNALKDKDVQLTTYTYRPLVGVTKKTGPNGETTTYEYDRFNRLSRVIGHDGKTIETYSYDYR